MQDPFGNEFCLVRPLTMAESEAVVRAGQAGSGNDDHWREVARGARGLTGPTITYPSRLRGDHHGHTHH
jgi:hypothetical protein